MGQNQSGFSDASDRDELGYSPHAVGYTHSPTSSRGTNNFQAPYGLQKRSLVGPIRREARRKSQHPPSSPSILQEGREENIDLLRQVVANTLGTPELQSDHTDGFSHAEILSDTSAAPSVLVTAANSKKDSNHIPAQETIIEETESMMPESSRFKCTDLPALDTLSPSDHNLDYNHLFASAPDLSLILASRRPSGTSLSRVLTDENDRQMIMAYMQQSTPDPSIHRRHSVSETEGVKTATEMVRASPYRSVPGRWTSSYDVGQATPIGRSMNGGGSITPSRSYRKPVPAVQQSDKVNNAIQLASPSNVAEKQQYFLWPAKISTEGADHGEGEAASRGSVSSDALHSHVEALREGPRYIVDPTASNLMRSPDDILKVLHSPSTPAVALTGRPRKASLLNKLKERVLKKSEPTTVSIPVEIATSQPSTTMGKKSGGITVRESWTSSDGPWEAHIVSMESKKMSPVRGFAQPVKQSSFDMLRKDTKTSSSSALMKAIDDTEMTGWSPVPFAETAVQASLAALQALEAAEEGDDLKSIWKRERLMGSSHLSSTTTPALHQVDTSISEMNKYARSRRRAAPYPTSDSASSLGNKSKQEKSKKRSDRRNRRGDISSGASHTEEHSGFLAFTSDSDRAGHGHGKSDGTLQHHKDTTIAEKSRVSKSSADIVKDVASGAIASPSPALAMRFREEAQLDSKAVTNSGPIASPQHRDSKKQLGRSVSMTHYRNTEDDVYGEGNTMKEWRKQDETYDKKRENGNNEKKPMTSMQSEEGKRRTERHKKEATLDSKPILLPRQSKIRKGYGCDDIEAWQASLALASARIGTLPT